ncbi:MAG: 30S ribosomal protein S17 [Dehalococcoidia bacterium]
MADEPKVNRKSRTGTVVSDKNDKTIVVAIERASRHRIYHKVIRRTKRYHAHDEANTATLGDLVRIEEARPTSKTKRWRLVEVLTEREVARVAPESIDQSLVEEVQRSAARATTEDEASETVVAAETEAAPEASAEASPPEGDVEAAAGDEAGADADSDEEAGS